MYASDWRAASDFGASVFRQFDNFCREVAVSSTTAVGELAKIKLHKNKKMLCPICKQKCDSKIGLTGVVAQHISFSSTFSGYSCKKCDDVRCLRDSFGRRKTERFSESVG